MPLPSHCSKKLLPSKLKKSLSEGVDFKLTPDEIHQVVLQYKSLPTKDKHTIHKSLQRSCAWCEKEMHLPNMSDNHGMCYRHAKEQWAEMGAEAPTHNDDGTPMVYAPDLATLTPEELQLAAKIVAARRMKHGKGSSYNSGDALEEMHITLKSICQ